MKYASVFLCGKRVRALRIDGRTGVSYFRSAFWFVDGNKLFRVRGD